MLPRMPQDGDVDEEAEELEEADDVEEVKVIVGNDGEASCR